MALFGVGFLGLVGVVSLTVYYAITHRPVTDLPGVQKAVQPVPPRWLFAFGGTANPIGIAVSPDGQRIYVSEGGGERQIKVFDRAGKLQAQLAPPGSEAPTRAPGPLGVDAQGRLYVAERMQGEIQTYSPSLEWEGAFRPPALDEMKGWLPGGVSVGPDGRIYVTDTGSSEHQVLVLTTDGTLADRLSRSSGVPGGLNYPVQAVADEDGRVYISDGNNSRVLVVSPRGTQVLGGPVVEMPRGLTVADGKLYVADAVGNHIDVYTTGDQPQFLYTLGEGAGQDGLAYPNAVAVDRTGRVYVADRVNNRVQVWTY